MTNDTRSIPNEMRRLLGFVTRRGVVLGVLAIIALEVTLQLAAPRFRVPPVDLAINADGYRGERAPIEKPAGEKRILTLGDSVTYGTGVETPLVWPAQFESILTRDGDESINVINGGNPGASPQSLHAFYQSKWAAYDADEVILAVSPNMVSLAWIYREGDPRDIMYRQEPALGRVGRIKAQVQEITGRCCLLNALQSGTTSGLYRLGVNTHLADTHDPRGPMLAFGMMQGGLDASLPDLAWTALESGIAALRDTLRAENRRLTILYLPTRFALSDRLTDNLKFVPTARFTIDPAERLREISERLHVPFIDPTSSLLDARADREASGEAAPLYILDDYMHPDATGHRAIAGAVARAVARND